MICSTLNKKLRVQKASQKFEAIEKLKARKKMSASKARKNMKTRKSHKERGHVRNVKKEGT